MMPILGFGMLLKMLDIKKLMPFFFIGFALSTFAGFSMIGATMVALCIAVLYDNFSKKQVKATASSEEAAKADDLDAIMQ